MPLSKRVGDDPNRISREWFVECALARMLVRLESFLEQIFSAEGLRWPGLHIISGHRTAAEQREVNPANPNSLHVRCPSLAVDLRVGDVPASVTPVETWQQVGQAWKAQGGRWGGDFDPPDLNHFDLGHSLQAL